MKFVLNKIRRIFNLKSSDDKEIKCKLTGDTVTWIRKEDWDMMKEFMGG